MNRSGIVLPLLILATLAARAQAITVAAAADLQYALDEIASTYRKAHPGQELAVVYGSSGKLETQIRQGAPFDIFFSADISIPQALARDGFAGSSVLPYATGRLVIWSGSKDVSKWTLADLVGSSATKVAIANPQHAPYGKRAEEALRKVGVWEKVQPKLVYGENISQTLQFAQTGAADVGLVAQSLVLGLDPAKRGSWVLVPDSLHSPLVQGWVLTARAAKNDTAKAFANFVASPAGKQILGKYGFTVPTAATAK